MYYIWKHALYLINIIMFDKNNMRYIRKLSYIWKSTIIEILTGISKPTKGSITVDDNSIFSNIRGWQNLIGFVPQKIFILDESLRNNILFGLDNKKYPDEKIISMIKKVENSLEKFIDVLKKQNELSYNKLIN